MAACDPFRTLRFEKIPLKLVIRHKHERSKHHLIPRWHSTLQSLQPVVTTLQLDKDPPRCALTLQSTLATQSHL